MFQRRSHGHARRNNHVEIVPLKGLFTDGIWQCNCSPRLPAEHFQTKNGGRNHGRWFYTCQRPQPTRCTFFLWDDEAKPREASAVLDNARSEPSPHRPPTPATHPVKPPITPEPEPPYTPSKPPRSAPSRPLHPSTLSSPDEEFYDWPASDVDSLVAVADHAAMAPLLETPRKAVTTEGLVTPGKRRYEEMAYPTPSTTRGSASVAKAPSDQPVDDDDVFTTPTTLPHARSLFAPLQDPPPPHSHPPNTNNNTPPPAPPSSSLTAEILATLHTRHINLDDETAAAVQAVCAGWERRLHGVVRGREVSRLIIREKKGRVAELLGRIAGLEAEREGRRAVVEGLRSEARRRDGGVGGGGT